jgi:Protein of unknown function (DUF3396)
LTSCGIISPRHATASPGLVFTDNCGTSSDVMQAFPLIQRFPGLDYVNTSDWAAATKGKEQDKIRTIDWLTALDSRFAEELGGMA